MPIACYTQRLLNPFRGMINCIRYESVDAVTRDGVLWDIDVSNDRLLEGMDTGRRMQISDIRYGRWSLETGLNRGPLYPSDDFKYLEHMGAIVYEHLLEVHDRIPFPLEDRFELWLMDREARSLALLDTAVRREDIELDQCAEWRAGPACRQTFTSTVADRLALEPEDEGALAGASGTGPANPGTPGRRGLHPPAAGRAAVAPVPGDYRHDSDPGRPGRGHAARLPA